MNTAWEKFIAGHSTTNHQPLMFMSTPVIDQPNTTVAQVVLDAAIEWREARLAAVKEGAECSVWTRLANAEHQLSNAVKTYAERKS